ILAMVGLGVIPVGIAGLVFAVILARKVYDSGAAVVLCGVLMLIPLASLITLLVVNNAATRALREHGIKVGLLGASMPAGRGSERNRRGLAIGLVLGIGALMLLCGGGGFLLLRWAGELEGDWPVVQAMQGG